MRYGMNDLKMEVATMRHDIARIIQAQEHPFANAVNVARKSLGAVYVIDEWGWHFLGTGCAVYISDDREISGTFLRNHMVADYLRGMSRGRTIVIKYPGAAPYQLLPGRYEHAPSVDLFFVRGLPVDTAAMSVERNTVVEPGTQALLYFMRRVVDQIAEFSCVVGSVSGGDSSRPLFNARVTYGCCAGMVLSCAGGTVRLVGILGQRAAPEVPETVFVGGERRLAALTTQAYRTLMTEIAEPTACVGSAVVYDFLQIVGHRGG
jgi:hypothetical protein